MSNNFGKENLQDQLDASASRKLKDLKKQLEQEEKLKDFYRKQGYNKEEASAKAKHLTELAYIKEEQKEEKKAQEELYKYQIENSDSFWERQAAKRKLENEANKKSLAENLDQLAENAKKVSKAALNAADSGISKAFKTYQDYLGSISTRLLGSNKTYRGVLETITTTAGASPLVSQQKVLENLSKMVEAGIVANVEQRAFLATVSDRIATTFDSFDSNMLRLIRIQQADTTAARLGIESALNKFLNETFSDTSYLSDIKTQNISEILQNVEAQMGYKSGVAFDYAVQKWLGSMYSVGVSSNTIQSLAQGLASLGSGDLSGLSGNSQLQTLLLLASQASGVDYANLLTGGYSGTSQVDKIMSGVIKTLQSISTSNQVVRAQYANLLGVSIADLTAISNLSQKDIEGIASSIMNYNSAIKETGNALSTIGQRISTAEKLENAVNNMWATIGEGIYSNALTAGTWIVTDMLKSSGIADDLKFSVFGTSVDPIGLIRTGIVGMGAISRIGSLVKGLTNWSGLKLDLTNAEAGFSRGGREGSSIVTEDVSSMLSYSSTFGSTTEKEITQESITAAETNAASYTGETPTTKEDEEELLKNYVGDKLDSIYALLSRWDNRLPFGITPGL